MKMTLHVRQQQPSRQDFFNYQFILKFYQGLYFLQLVRKKIKMCFTLSVMKLATAVNLSTYTPVCLPDSGKDFSGRVS
jgi:hypothetical protein